MASGQNFNKRRNFLDYFKIKIIEIYKKNKQLCVKTLIIFINYGSWYLN